MQKFNNDAPHTMLSLLKQRVVYNDKPMIDDQRLRTVASGEAFFSSSEQQMLIQSPLTLRRFEMLLKAHKRAEFLAKEWTEYGVAELLAASSHDSDDLSFSLDSPEGEFSVSWSKTPQGELITILKVDEALALDENTHLQLIDDQNLVLLDGYLDEDHEVVAPWALEISPRLHLASTGKVLRLRAQKTNGS